MLAPCQTLAITREREGYGEPCDVTSLSLSRAKLRYKRLRYKRLTGQI